MPNYENAVIYKLVCRDPEVKECYVGSTCDLRQRKQEHRNTCANENHKQHHLYVYQHIRAMGGWDNWEVIQIEEHPCTSKRELEARERHWLEALGATLNKIVPYRTREEKREYNSGWQREKYASDPEYREEYNAKAREKYASDPEWRDEQKAKEHERMLDPEYRENKNAKRREKVTCEHCGSVVNKNGLKRHQQSKKCIAHQ